MKEFRYVEYTFEKSNGDEKQIKVRMKKARGLKGKTWSIGQALFKDNFQR